MIKAFKKTTISFLMTMALSITAKSQNDCLPLLQDGLYKTFNIVKKENFNQDIKNYFTSNTFKKDLKIGKWGGTIGIPIEGVPIELGASSSDEEISNFQQKLLSSNSFTLNSSFYDKSILRIPDVELAQKYVDCVNGKFDFKVTATITSNYVVFKVTYYNKISTDPMPKFGSLSILGASNISNSLSKDQTMSNETAFTCSRNSKTDIMFVLQTDRGTAIFPIPEEKYGSTKPTVPAELDKTKTQSEHNVTLSTFTVNNDKNHDVWAELKVAFDIGAKDANPASVKSLALYIMDGQEKKLIRREGAYNVNYRMSVNLDYPGYILFKKYGSLTFVAEITVGENIGGENIEFNFKY